MARKVVGSKIVSFLYLASVDGFTVGTTNLQVRVPENGVIVWGFVKVITTLVSAGAATIAVGFSLSNNAFIAPLAVANWTAGAIIEGVDLIRNMIEYPQLAVMATEFNVTVAVDTITVGRFIYVCKFVEIDE